MIGIKLNIYLDSYIRQKDVIRSVIDALNAENEGLHEAVRNEFVLISYDGRPDHQKERFSLIISDDTMLLAEFSAYSGTNTLFIGDCSTLSENELQKIDNILPTDMPRPVLYKGIRHIIEGIVGRYSEWLYKYLFQSLIDSSPDMVWVKDENGRHVILNEAFGKVVNKPVDLCLYKEHPDIWDIPWDEYESSDFACRRSEESILSTRKMGTFEELVLTGGDIKQFTTYKTPLFDDLGNVIGTCGIGHDVTNLSNMGIELMMLVDNIPFPMAVLDADWNTVQMNTALKDMAGVRKAENFKYRDWKSSNLKPVGEIIHSEDLKSSRQEFEFIKGDKSYSFNVLEQVIMDFQGNVTGYFCLMEDITYQRIYEDSILSAANTDVLTGLYNRRYFYEYLEDNISGQMTLLYMDLDNFKKINDTYSHARGDDILKRTAGHIKEFFPEGIVARLGGDEYAVILSGGINQAELDVKCHRLEKAVRNLCRPGGPYVTISIGIAFTDGSRTVDDLINDGDSLMYEVKKKHHEIMDNDPAVLKTGSRQV